MLILLILVTIVFFSIWLGIRTIITFRGKQWKKFWWYITIELILLWILINSVTNLWILKIKSIQG